MKTYIAIILLLAALWLSIVAPSNLQSLLHVNLPAFLYLNHQSYPYPEPYPYPSPNIYLPAVQRGIECDPSFTQVGSESIDNQTLDGTTLNDNICQYGEGGNDVQHNSGLAGDDNLFQNGGGGADDQTSYGGEGNDYIRSYAVEAKT